MYAAGIPPIPPTDEQRFYSIGATFIRALLLNPSDQTFAEDHRLIVNRVLIPTPRRDTMMPSPNTITRLELSGVSTYTDQWPPGLTCISCVRICTANASYYISGAWKFSMSPLNPFLLPCTGEVLNLHIHVR